MGRLDPYRSERIPEAVEQGYRMCHLQGMICPLSSRQVKYLKLDVDDACISF